MNIMIILLLLLCYALLSSTASTPPVPFAPVQKIGNPDPTNCENFGNSVVISPDGSTATTSCPGFQNGLGLVYVFVRTAVGHWIPQATLNGTDKTGESTYEGYSMALSYTGNTLASGAPNQFNGEGGVYVYVRTDDVWSQQALLDSNSFSYQKFGQSVALSYDGITLAISYNTLSATGILIFVWTGTIWEQQGTPLADLPYDSPISLSADGNTVAIAGDIVPGSFDRLGVQIFKRSGMTWNGFTSNPVTVSEIQAGAVTVLADVDKYIFTITRDGWVAFEFNGTHYEEVFLFVDLQLPNYKWLSSNANGSQILITPESGDTALVLWRNSISLLSYQLVQTVKPIQPQTGRRRLQRGEDREVEFGHTTSISADGIYAVFSGRLDNDGKGAIYFYERKLTGNCKPQFGLQKAACTRRIKNCGKQGFQMKWTGPGCKKNGKKVGDGGCQCKGYCGYTCKKACNKDKTCKWQSGICTDKSGNIGGVILHC